ncbi:MAG TPA: hypothetical protein VFB68_10380 [Xanthobacteraceae bacterium]|nr:hypothetical protein [Xanthobacteraceae bacterium]
MSSAVPSVPSGSAAPPKRRKFGTYSFVLAILAFAVFTAVFGVYTQVPSRSTEMTQWLAQWFAIVGFLAIVTLMELTGIVLGIAALFRSGDRKILGALGAVLNLFLLISGVSLGLILIAHLGGARP